MKKLLVLFPGVGYSTARPLLYYAKRMGQEKGYEVLELVWMYRKNDIKEVK